MDFDIIKNIIDKQTDFSNVNSARTLMAINEKNEKFAMDIAKDQELKEKSSMIVKTSK